jgi:hypothetical protein
MAGGIGAVSIGFDATLVGFLILIAVVFGLWKLGQLLWAALAR